MYQNKAAIDATATANGGTAFVSTYYYSSSEYNSNDAWDQGFASGNQGGGDKSNASRVRAVRAF